MLMNRQKTFKVAQQYLSAPLVLLAFGLFLRFFLITNQSLWYDEGLSLANSDAYSFAELVETVRNISNSDKFQPFYYIILYWIRGLFGDSEFVLRSFSAIFGFLCLPVIYLTSNRLYGRKHAIWTLALVTFSAFLVYYSQEIRNYSLLIFISSLQLYFFSDVLLTETPQKSSSKVFFAIASALNLFGSVTTLVFTAALSLSHLIAIRNLKQWVVWWAPTAVLSLLPLLYFYNLPGEVDPGKVTVSRFGFPIFFNAAYVVYGILTGLTYGPSQEQLRGADKIAVLADSWLALLVFLVVTIVLAVLVVRIFFQRNAKSKLFKLDAFFLLLAVSSFVLGIVLALVTKMNWVPRHSFFLWLPLSMLLPSIIHGPYFKNKIGANQLGFSKLALISLICLNLYSNFNYFFNEKYWRDDYRSVAHYLVQEKSSDNETALLFGSHNLLEYYGDSQTVDANSATWRLMDGDENWVGQLSQLVGNPDELVLAVNREHALNQFDSVENSLSESYKIDSVVDRFTYFKIYHLASNE